MSARSRRLLKSVTYTPTASILLALTNAIANLVTEAKDESNAYRLINARKRSHAASI